MNISNLIENKTEIDFMFFHFACLQNLHINIFYESIFKVNPLQNTQKQSKSNLKQKCARNRVFSHEIKWPKTIKILKFISYT